MTPGFVFSLVFLPAIAGFGQVLIQGEGGPVRLIPADAAILEGHELRTDMTCGVKAIQPELGFDLSFHSGYEVSVPLGDLAGKGNELMALFRVIPEEIPDKEIYFSQRWIVPVIAEGAKGTAILRGEFVLGKGKYQVEWLMRDRDQRYCSARWAISADAHGKDKQIELRLARGSAAPEATEPFVGEAPVARDTDHGIRVVVLLHIASQESRAAGMRTMETAAVLSILRSIAREPRIGSYSITAFNLERNEILFRRENAAQVDFPALGEAIKKLQLGTIDVHRLGQDDSGMEFLGGLLSEELARNHPDALIFVGPKTAAEFSVRGALKDLGDPHCPVFYLNYSADPAKDPWRDAIGSVVKLWKGVEYTITRPRDLFVAWNEVMYRLSNRESVTSGADRTAAPSLLPKK
jgi:hypothetical protein